MGIFARFLMGLSLAIFVCLTIHHLAPECVELDLTGIHVMCVQFGLFSVYDLNDCSIVDTTPVI